MLGGLSGVAVADPVCDAHPDLRGSRCRLGAFAASAARDAMIEAAPNDLAAGNRASGGSSRSGPAGMGRSSTSGGSFGSNAFLGPLSFHVS